MGSEKLLKGSIQEHPNQLLDPFDMNEQWFYSLQMTDDAQITHSLGGSSDALLVSEISLFQDPKFITIGKGWNVN